MENISLDPNTQELDSEENPITIKDENSSPLQDENSTTLQDENPNPLHDEHNLDPFIFPNVSDLNFNNDNNNDGYSEENFKYRLRKANELEQKKIAKSKKESVEEERERMQVLVSNFTEEQLDRYEMYRRSAFPKAAIKRIMQTITGNSVSPNVVIGMSGIAKVFIGEIVEEALDIMEENKDTGALLPKHLREAVRRLRAKGKIPSLLDKK